MHPTIGRRVYFWPVGTDMARFNVNDPLLPLDAGVVYVHPSNRHVNLLVTDHQGQQQAVLAVPFMQAHEAPPDESYAEWMPFQRQEQAKSTTGTLGGDPPTG